jgi:hypothetical protein
MSFFSGGKKEQQPQPQPAPYVPPKATPSAVNSKSIDAALEAAKKLKAKQAGYQMTKLTGSGGIKEDARTAGKSLLGA